LERNSQFANTTSAQGKLHFDTKLEIATRIGRIGHLGFVDLFRS
jgi:hypothetical protein